jgi:dCTP diphosphatase
MSPTHPPTAPEAWVSLAMNNTPPEGNPDSLQCLRDALRQFAVERDWDQFHFPKNLAIALSVEAAELLEHFQWMSESDSASISEQTSARVREELADVLLYLIRLADKLNIDLSVAAAEKLRINAAKYPIDKSRGNSKKYTEL